MLSADKGGASGGSDSKTDLEQLNEANSRITALEGDVKSAGEKVTKLEGELKIAAGQVTKLQGEATSAGEKITKLEGDLKSATDETAKLKGEAKSTDERAREQAASMGVTGSAKSDDGKVGTASGDGKAIYEAYEKLMTDGKSAEASAYWAAHEKELKAYSNSLGKASD